MSSRRRRRNRSSRWFAAVVVVVALIIGVTAAGADAFDDARKVFSEAEALYADKKYDKAADKYTEAYRIIRSPLILFNIGQARRLLYKNDGDYRNLVAAKLSYERFLAEAEPNEEERVRAETTLDEVKQDGIAVAKTQFAAAEKAMRLSKFPDAILGYEAAYDLTGRVGILFNLAQAQRKQFRVDAKLERLAHAEELIIQYKRDAEGAVEPEVIEEILKEIREERAEYHRQREAEARTAESKAMTSARENYQRGDAATALTYLDEAVKIKDNPRVVLMEIYRLRGQAAAVAGKNDEAVDAFKRYLALEPAADATGLSETAKPAFEQAHKFWEGRKPLAIDHLPPGRIAPGKSAEIPVRVASDPLSMVANREIRYRRQGDAKWEAVTIGKSKDAAKLPPAPMPIVGKEYRMEYYVVAVNEHRGVLDSLGRPKTPLAYLVTKDEIVYPTPIYKRWWVWTAAAAVIAGSAITYVIVTDDGLPDGDIIADVSKGLVSW